MLVNDIMKFGLGHLSVGKRRSKPVELVEDNLGIVLLQISGETAEIGVLDLGKWDIVAFSYDTTGRIEENSSGVMHHTIGIDYERACFLHLAASALFLLSYLMDNSL